MYTSLSTSLSVYSKKYNLACLVYLPIEGNYSIKHDKILLILTIKHKTPVDILIGILTGVFTIANHTFFL